MKRLIRMSHLRFNRIRWMSAALTGVVATAGCGGGSGGPTPMPTAGATPTATPTAAATGKIAFTSRGGVWVMNADGSGKKQLTSNPAADRYTSFDIAGRKIAFTSFRNGAPDIYIMNADGSAQTRVTNDAGVERSPSLRGDGRKIAFSRDGIYVINSDGSGETQLRSTGIEPAFSPDGSKIAFRDSAFVYVMNSDGTSVRRLTKSSNSRFSEQSPSFSPDGRKIAFFRDATYVINVDGSGETRLPDSGDEPTFSPDGSKIAFIKDPGAPSPGPAVVLTDIYIINSDGTNPVNLTNNRAADHRDLSWAR